MITMNADIHEATSLELEATDPTFFARACDGARLPMSADVLRDLLLTHADRQNVIILGVGHPLEGLCWMELVTGGAVFIHLLYLEGEQRLKDVWPAIYEIAKSRGCTQMFAHVFRVANARLFKSCGFRYRGLLISREVT